jgi:microcin C transport system permease protein
VPYPEAHYPLSMFSYFLKRLLLMIPTLFGIMLVSFIIIQFVPGGPVERMIAQMQGHGGDATARFSGAMSDTAAGSGQITGNDSGYRGAQGLDPEFVKELEKMYGFDKPAHIRFFEMIKNYIS